MEKVREAMTRVGIDTSRYSSDSFRIGAATAAAAAGLEDCHSSPGTMVKSSFLMVHSHYKKGAVTAYPDTCETWPSLICIVLKKLCENLA